MNRAEYENGVLGRLGVYQVGAFRAFGAWMKAESGDERCNGVSGDGAAWNPINVAGHTPPPGCTPYNTFASGTLHVWNYPTYLDGVEATVKVLLQPNMAGILAAMRRDGAFAQEVADAIAASPWGTLEADINNALAAYRKNPAFYNGLPIGP